MHPAAIGLEDAAHLIASLGGYVVLAAAAIWLLIRWIRGR